MTAHSSRPSRPNPQARYDDGPVMIWGAHSVEAALRNKKRRILKVMLTVNAEHRVADLIAERGLTPERVLPRDLDLRLGPDTVHQGAFIEAEPLKELPVADMAEAAATAGLPIVLLDQVTDPHNVGAILRSAAVFGCGGVIMTQRHSPPLTGVLAKTASGALDLVPVTLVQNLARTMAELKASGFQIIGLDGGAETDIADVVWPKACALVLGAEGRGLRELTRNTCDIVAKIGADRGTLDSLNVSNASAVALHVASMRRRATR